MTYPRYSNGHVDTGRKLNDRRCPNCGSDRFVETVSREHCPACGLTCDYWGSGANDVYERMIARNHEAEERRREEELRREHEEYRNWLNGDD